MGQATQKVDLAEMVEEWCASAGVDDGREQLGHVEGDVDDGGGGT